MMIPATAELLQPASNRCFKRMTIHDPEVEKRYFHMAKDGWEKFRYVDTINDYNSLIEEFEKLYEQHNIKRI